MGVDATVTLERPGFMQAGGGVLTAEIGPIKRWKKLKLTERGEPMETFGRVLHAHLPGEIAKREIVTASKILEWPENYIDLRYANDCTGTGNAMLLGAHLADQLLLPMALAGGGVFHTLSITDHTRTNMALIEQFLAVKFGVEEMGAGLKEVLCN